MTWLQPDSRQVPEPRLTPRRVCRQSTRLGASFAHVFRSDAANTYGAPLCSKPCAGYLEDTYKDDSEIDSAHEELKI